MIKRYKVKGRQGRRVQIAACLLAAMITVASSIPSEARGETLDGLINRLTHPAGNAVEVLVQAQAIHVPELSDTRTEWLNRLLGHIVVRLRMDGPVQEETIEVDGAEALRCTSRNGEQGEEYVFSFDGNTAYTAEYGTDLLSELSGIATGESRTEYYSMISLMIPEFYAFFSGLPEEFPEASASSKASVRYKDFGTATGRWTITLDGNMLASEKMTEYLSREGMENVRIFLSGVVLSGRQRVTLLTDSEGRVMKINYTGKAGLSEDDMRNVDVDWRCMRRDTEYKDTIQMKTPAVSGTKRKNITVSREMTVSEEETESYICSVETDQVIDRTRTRVQLNVTLTGEGEHISGEIREKTITGNSTDLTAIQINLEKDAQDEYRGSLEITHELGKIEKEHYRLQIAVRKCGPISWPAEMISPINEETKAMLKERMSGAFLRALAPVPEDDLQYILSDLPEGWWNEMTKSLKETEETEKP